MITYIIFKKKYHSIFANYTFYKDVKYALKGEDNKYYYTIKGVRLRKSSNHTLFEIYNSNN